MTVYIRAAAEYYMYMCSFSSSRRYNKPKAHKTLRLEYDDYDRTTTLHYRTEPMEMCVYMGKDLVGNAQDYGVLHLIAPTQLEGARIWGMPTIRVHHALLGLWPVL